MEPIKSWLCEEIFNLELHFFKLKKPKASEINKNPKYILLLFVFIYLFNAKGDKHTNGGDPSQ